MIIATSPPPIESISSSASDVIIDVQKNLFRSTAGNNVRAQFNAALPAGFQWVRPPQSGRKNTHT